MRVKLPWSRAALLAGMVIVALLLTFPLRLAAGWLGLDDFGLNAREVRGSVWNGRLSEARVATLPIGDVASRLNVFPLLGGRARVDLSRDGDSADRLEGAISVSANRRGIDDATVRLPLGPILAPLPLLAMDLSDVTVRFKDGLCEVAEGRVRAEIDGGALGLSLAGGLSGNVRCDGGALLMPLVSQSGMEALSLRLLPGNRYKAEVMVRPGEAGPERLLGSGFALRGDSYILSLNGSL